MNVHESTGLYLDQEKKDWFCSACMPKVFISHNFFLKLKCILCVNPKARGLSRSKYQNFLGEMRC